MKFLARREGLEVDLNTNIGGLIARFVEKVKESEKEKEGESREDK